MAGETGLCTVHGGMPSLAQVPKYSHTGHFAAQANYPAKMTNYSPDLKNNCALVCLEEICSLCTHTCVYLYTHMHPPVHHPSPFINV